MLFLHILSVQRKMKTHLCIFTEVRLDLHLETPFYFFSAYMTKSDHFDAADFAQFPRSENKRKPACNYVS